MVQKSTLNQALQLEWLSAIRPEREATPSTSKDMSFFQPLIAEEFMYRTPVVPCCLISGERGKGRGERAVCLSSCLLQSGLMLVRCFGDGAVDFLSTVDEIFPTWQLVKKLIFSLFFFIPTLTFHQ